MIQIQLAVLFFSTCFVLLRQSSNPSVSTTLSSATESPTCVDFARKAAAVHQLSSTNYINFFTITGGDTTRCADVIKGMDEVIAQYDYVDAALLIAGRKIILSPSNNVGLSNKYDASYDAPTRVYALGKSAMEGQAHLENKLREIFFYGACNAYQIAHNKDSTSYQPFIKTEDAENLERALKKGYKALKKYRQNLPSLDSQRDRDNAILRKQVKEMQDHYTYPTNTDQAGNQIYKNVDPLRAALIEAESMFIPAWIDELKKENGAGNVLKMRIALLYAEIPKPLIEKFFPSIQAHVDHMVNFVKEHHKNDPFAAKSNNNIRVIEDLADDISERYKKSF